MRARQLLPWSVAVLALAGLAWWALDRQAPSDVAVSGEALPGFAARIEALERIEVGGGGGARRGGGGGAGGAGGVGGRGRGGAAT
ncbi:MAG: hypothetical protein K0M64_00660, partial [Rhizobium sp.]|nr:hypothetical protein [Rhizobium sp.]